MEKLLQKIKDAAARKGLKDFEIYLKRSRGVSITVRDQKPDSVENQDSLGFGLRVRVADNGSGLYRPGFSYGRAFDDPSIGIVVDSALASARAATPDRFHLWPEGECSYPPVANYDKTVAQKSRDEKTGMALEMEKTALNLDSRIKRARYVSYGESVDEVLIFNSSGLFASHQSSHLSLSIMPVAEEGGASEMYYEFASTPFWEGLKPRELALSAAQMAVDLLGGKRGANYRGPVLLHPSVAVSLLEVFAPSATAENVAKKNSCLIGKMGEKLYSSVLTIIDDGLYAGGEETAPFDAEGTPRQKTVIVDRGVVKNLLYDAYWAGRDRTHSTGNARRASAVAQPKLEYGNFFIQPGSTPPDKLADLERAILVTEVIGMHTADPISGDFSVGMQGFLIEKGKKKQPIRSMALTGNLHEFFSKIVDVGSDLRFYGQFGAPTVLIEEASVSGE